MEIRGSMMGGRGGGREGWGYLNILKRRKILLFESLGSGRGSSSQWQVERYMGGTLPSKYLCIV